MHYNAMTFNPDRCDTDSEFYVYLFLSKLFINHTLLNTNLF